MKYFVLCKRQRLNLDFVHDKLAFMQQCDVKIQSARIYEMDMINVKDRHSKS